MILKVIFAQLKEEYSGQWAPAALAVMNEHDYEENPEWLDNKMTDYKKVTNFTSLHIVDIEVDGNKIYNILNEKPRLAGKVKR